MVNQVLLGVGLVLLLLRRTWEKVFLTAVVIALTLVPALVFRRYGAIIPPEYQFVAAFFNFASWFFGLALDFYTSGGGTSC